MNALRLGHLTILFAAFSAPAHGQEAPAWPDTREARLSALALIQTLNSAILASRSATQVLQKWCGDHQLAAEPRIVAHRVKGTDKALSAEQRQRLQITDTDKARYRRVELRCGNQVLSVADNWYVPARLGPEMNRLLDMTDMPFGLVVRPLEPYRLTISARLLWSPLPDGWEHNRGAVPAATDAPLAIPDALFEHRAVLYTREHLPFSEVHEVYQRRILAFPAPSAH